MADNVGYTPGSGSTVAADDIGGVLHQRVKIIVGADGTNDGDVSSANPMPVSLPATAATGAKQDTGNTSVASIDTKTPALGQALAASSVPVVLTAAQIATLTPLTTLNLEATQALVKAKTDNLDVALSTRLKAADTLAGVTTVAAVTSITNTVAVQGELAHDAVDSGNPVKIGGKAASTVPTPVADGDRTQAWYDLFGRQVVTDLDPELNLAGGMTVLRDRLYAQRYTVLADSVADGLASFWTITTANGGSVAVSVGEGLLQTSAVAGGLAQMVSTAPAYYPGQVAWLNSAVRFGDTGIVGSTLRVGACTVSGTTPQDGFFYELNGITLNAVTVRAGVQTVVASTAWTRVIPSPFTLDTNFHQWELRWTANSVNFLIDNVVRHAATGGGSTLTGTLNFPIFIQVVNTSAGANRLIGLRNIGLGRFGTPDPLIPVAQGASSASLTGPMVQGLVSDSPESYLDNTLRPLSLTNEGRLRVSTVAALRDIDFYDDDMPVGTGNPSFIGSPWASAIW